MDRLPGWLVRAFAETWLVIYEPDMSRSLSIQRDALVPEQPALALQPAAIFDQRAVGADQAVTGHDDTDRIGAVGMADRTHGFRHVQSRRQRAVAHGGAHGNLRQRSPDFVLERR